jgi:hypothetical protein
MQFDATVRSGSCCEDDQVVQNPLTMDDVTGMMAASQWCGCGAKPGHGLMPGSILNAPQKRCTGFQNPRPMTLPGYGAGPHGLEMGVLGDVPNVNADYPLIWQLPDTDFNPDPMDPHVWNPATTRHGGHTDPWAPWGYSAAPKV